MVAAARAIAEAVAAATALGTAAFAASTTAWDWPRPQPRRQRRWIPQSLLQVLPGVPSYGICGGGCNVCSVAPGAATASVAALTTASAAF